MEFFTTYTILPTPKYVELLRYLLVMTYLIFLPYMGVVVGAMLLSFHMNLLDKDKPKPRLARFAKDVMDIAVPTRTVAVVLGILPMGLLWLIYGQWLYNVTPPTFALLPVGGVVVALGLVAALMYKGTMFDNGQNSYINLFLGATALTLVVFGMYVLLGAITRFNDPERWYLNYDPVRLLTSWNVIWRYLYFFMSSLAITGAAVLYFRFEWSGAKPSLDEGYDRFAKNFASGVGMAGSLLIPPLAFFYLFTTPIIALSPGLYGVFTTALVVLALAFAIFYLNVTSDRVRFGRQAFVLFVVAFLFVIVGDQLTFVNATREHTTGIILAAEEKHAVEELEREAARSASITVDLARGEEVFKSVCMTCHRLDVKLVGPPLQTVLPKYSGKVGELEAFIQSPSKKNPDYPPMPAPGLPLGDVKSVAAYVLGLVGADASGSAPAGGTH